jgi:hypothetical protein
MSLYHGFKDFGKKAIVAGSFVYILSGCAQPTLEQNKDLTGDDIPDAIVDIKFGPQHGTWLFIGQEDGSFVRAKEYVNNDLKYFKTDDGEFYISDGEFYRKIHKKD